MIWVLVSIIVVFACAIAYLAWRLQMWIIACNGWKHAYEKVRKKTPEDVLGLEIATNGQLFNELRRRPNNHFIFLVPRQVQHGISVETHVCNIQPDEAMEFLFGAAHSMRKGMDGSDDGDGYSDGYPPSSWED